MEKFKFVDILKKKPFYRYNSSCPHPLLN